MPPVRRPRSRARSDADPGPAAALAELGLAAGDAVRFRRRDTERWKADGSLGVCDAKGAMRAFPLDLVEVRDRGPRGGVVWVPLPDWAARTEQLRLL
jgi:hypothetical protein